MLRMGSKHSYDVKKLSASCHYKLRGSVSLRKKNLSTLLAILLYVHCFVQTLVRLRETVGLSTSTSSCAIALWSPMKLPREVKIYFYFQHRVCTHKYWLRNWTRIRIWCWSLYSDNVAFWDRSIRVAKIRPWRTYYGTVLLESIWRGHDTALLGLLLSNISYNYIVNCQNGMLDSKIFFVSVFHIFNWKVVCQ